MKKQKTNTQLALRNGMSPTLRKPRRPRARTRIWQWQARFLAALRRTPNVQVACRAAGIARRTAYDRRERDPEFAQAWLDALGASIDALETKAFELAMAGDSTLITFMLRCHKPEIYNPTTRQDIGLLGGIVLIPSKASGPE